MYPNKEIAQILFYEQVAYQRGTKRWDSSCLRLFSYVCLTFLLRCKIKSIVGVENKVSRLFKELRKKTRLYCSKNMDKKKREGLWNCHMSNGYTPINQRKQGLSLYNHQYIYTSVYYFFVSYLFGGKYWILYFWKSCLFYFSLSLFDCLYIEFAFYIV